MADTLYFYKCTDANEKMYKRPTFLFNKEVDVMSGTRVDTPVFILHGDIDVANTNYAYSLKFKRYYYIKLTMLENGMWRIDGTVDVLQSFNSAICSREYLIDRQEHSYNPMLPDNIIQSRAGTTTSKKYIGNVGRTFSYVLTVTGGAAS